MDLKSMEGTNYYANSWTKDKLKLVHLGKAAYGIRFAFRWNPKYYRDYEGFKDFIKTYPVYNHFGNPVDPEFLLGLIMRKMGGNSIAAAFRKSGKGNLIHILEEHEKGKLVAKHHFVDEDFGIEPEKIIPE